MVTRSTVSHGRSSSYPGGLISADFKVTVTRVSLCPTFVTSSICPCALRGFAVDTAVGGEVDQSVKMFCQGIPLPPLPLCGFNLFEAVVNGASFIGEIYEGKFL